MNTVIMYFTVRYSAFLESREHWDLKKSYVKYYLVISFVDSKIPA